MTPQPQPPEARPPLGRWGRAYGVVMGALALWIVLFYLFGRVFR